MGWKLVTSPLLPLPPWRILTQPSRLSLSVLSAGPAQVQSLHAPDVPYIRHCNTEPILL
jgi:hypothetical protein